MKLSKLYSSDVRFKEITFKDGINIILGKITDDSNLSNDSHNLGKSTLIELIDFMFLKKVNKNHFLKNKSFNNHIFYLEIKLNTGNFMTIKRSVKNNTKISFKYHNQKNMNYTNEEKWDYTNLALFSKNKEENPVYILNKSLGFNILTNWDYRKTINYFFRTQYDYGDIFQLNKFKQGKDIDWKPILFELLGFNSENMKKKYEIDYKIKDKQNFINDYEEKFKLDTGKIDQIKGIIELKTNKKEEIEEWLDNFNFYKKEEVLNKEVIEKIEKRISLLNTKRYNLDYEIINTEEALNAQECFNLRDVLELYNSVKINFPDSLVKSYEELLNFNKEIFEERKKYLKESLELKKVERIEIEKNLLYYNKKRMNVLNDLKETDVFNKFKKYQEDLINIEREIERCQVEIENIDVLKSVKLEVDELYIDCKYVIDDLDKQIQESTELYKKIRNSFTEYFKEIFNTEAIISISMNNSGNVEFEYTIVNEDLEKTEETEGHSYRKMLCVAFDLSLLVNYINKSFYRVVYHDGSLESMDPRKKKNYINLINRLSEQYDFQYIFTALETDLPREDEFKIEENLVLTLTDEEDNSGRLFGFKY